MAEDTDEDLSMEDILSSIKNILVEDEVTSAPAAPQPQAVARPEPEVAAPVFAVQDKDIPADDDILELSPEMRIDEPLDEIAAVDEEEKLETAAQEESFPAADGSDFNFDEILNSNNELLSNLEADDSADPIYTPEDDAKAFAEDESSDADLTSDPFYEEHPDLQNMAEQYEPLPEVEAVPEIEVEAEPVIEAEPETEAIPEMEVEVQDVTEETSAAEMPVKPIPQEEAVWEQDTVTAPKAVEPQQPATANPERIANDSDAVDVSANIISNFAKMFTAQEEAYTAETPAVSAYETAAPSTKLGGGSKTIEDVVHEVIREVIADELVKDIQNKADFEALAKAEISAQTSRWLNANLPAIVESIVKQEIERVMAKVGS